MWGSEVVLEARFVGKGRALVADYLRARRGRSDTAVKLTPLVGVRGERGSGRGARVEDDEGDGLRTGFYSPQRQWHPCASGVRAACGSEVGGRA